MNASAIPADALVDDEKPIRTSLAEAPRSEGYSVLEAVGGDDALALLESNGFGIILLDTPMPQRSGRDDLEALDSPPNVILMSASSFEEKDKLSARHKVVFHPVKPVAPRRLPDEVEVALESGE